MNIKLRLQNWSFWTMLAIGVFGLVCSFLSMEASDFSSWTVVWESVLTIVSNPYFLVSIAIYIFGLITDTSTNGFKDSAVTQSKTDINQTAADIIKTAAETHQNVTTPTEIAAETEQNSDADGTNE